MFPGQPTPRTPYNWLSILAGIKFTPLDINKEKTKRLNELENELRSAIDEYNHLNYSDQIPTYGEIEKAYKTIALNYIYNKNNMKQVDELKNILDITGGNKATNLMLALARQPYDEQKKQISDMNMKAVIKYLQSLGINPTKQEIKDIIANPQE